MNQIFTYLNSLAILFLSILTWTSFPLFQCVCHLATPALTNLSALMDQRQTRQNKNLQCYPTSNLLVTSIIYNSKMLIYLRWNKTLTNQLNKIRYKEKNIYIKKYPAGYQHLKINKSCWVEPGLKDWWVQDMDQYQR